MMHKDKTQDGRGATHPLGRHLTLKQRTFCHNYVVEYNGKDSAIKSGYKPKSAGRYANTLLRNPVVKEYIMSIQDKKEKKLERDAQDVVDCLWEIKDKAMDNEDLSNANRSSELLGKHYGLFVDKKEITAEVTSTAVIVTPEELEEGAPIPDEK